jgi:hypothetical protein
MVWFRNAVGLTLVAVVALIVPNLPAHAAKGSKGGPPVPPQVRSAGEATLYLLHKQDLAIQRNTNYLQKRHQFNQVLMRLHQKVPRNAQQEQQIQGAIRYNSQLLAHVNRNIDLSRLHIESTLPGLVNSVGRLLDAIQRLSPNNPRVSAFVLFASRRQQSALDQLMDILNQENASQTVPGRG